MFRPLRRQRCRICLEPKALIAGVWVCEHCEFDCEDGPICQPCGLVMSRGSDALRRMREMAEPDRAWLEAN